MGESCNKRYFTLQQSYQFWQDVTLPASNMIGHKLEFPKTVELALHTFMCVYKLTCKCQGEQVQARLGCTQVAKRS